MLHERLLKTLCHKNSRQFLQVVLLRISCQQSANYAVQAPKKAGKGAAPVKKKVLAIETDAEKLCSTLVGGNIYKEGKDPVLEDDSKYPDWLWKLRLDREPIPLEELSQEDPIYWKRLKKLTMKHNNRFRSVRKF